MPDTPERAAGRARLDTLAAELLADPAVAWMRMFGAQGLSVRGKVFAFADSTGRLVVKLPEARVAELGGQGVASPMVMRDRPMREWAAVVPGADDDVWRELVHEARAFVEELAGG